MLQHTKGLIAPAVLTAILFGFKIALFISAIVVWLSDATPAEKMTAFLFLIFLNQ